MSHQMDVDLPVADQPNAGTSIYVGNIPFTTRWQELKDYFKQAGEIAFADVPRGNDGRSRGYGLVRYETAAEAQQAISMFNEVEWNGRKLSVREDSRPQYSGNHTHSHAPANGAPRSSAFGGSGGHPLFVGNLPWTTSWQDLKDLAKEHGLNPVRADVAFGHDGKSRGWGTLAFATPEEAQKAIQALNGLDVNGRQIEVREDRKRQ